MGSQNPHDSATSFNTESSYLLSDSFKLKATTSMFCPGLVKSTRQYHSIHSESSYLLSDSLKLKATTSMYCPGLVKSTRQYHFIQYRVFLFAFRLLKCESNHEHVLSWARKIHTTVPFNPLQ